jgi:hypothetical protein
VLRCTRFEEASVSRRNDEKWVRGEKGARAPFFDQKACEEHPDDEKWVPSIPSGGKGCELLLRTAKGGKIREIPTL